MVFPLFRRLFKRAVTLVTDLRFALLVLALIAVESSLGSIIEQDQSVEFYQLNYPPSKPIYGIIDATRILCWGLDHVYRTPFFLSLLVLLSLSLLCCSLVTQFPLVSKAKDLSFKPRVSSFFPLSLFVRFHRSRFLSEQYAFRFQQNDYYLYQKNNVLYGYQGILGRLSPILVHVSLLFILFGACWGAFQNVKDQEFLAQGEIFHLQNPVQNGLLSSIPNSAIRVNDFWVEYEANRIHQFYSNLSILDPLGNETLQQTISVNNPIHYGQLDIYQSDWSLLGLRLQARTSGETSIKSVEIPLFTLQTNPKAWITWLHSDEGQSSFLPEKGSREQQLENRSVWPLVVDQFQNHFYLYNPSGKPMQVTHMGDYLLFPTGDQIQWTNWIAATGLLMKCDPSIPFLYFGFGGLMFTTVCSYLPYVQIWMVNKPTFCWIGCQTNRGQLSLEIPFKTLFLKQR